MGVGVGGAVAVMDADAVGIAAAAGDAGDTALGLPQATSANAKTTKTSLIFPTSIAERTLHGTVLAR